MNVFQSIQFTTKSNMSHVLFKIDVNKIRHHSHDSQISNLGNNIIHICYLLRSKWELVCLVCTRLFHKTISIPAKQNQTTYVRFTKRSSAFETNDMTHSSFRSHLISWPILESDWRTLVVGGAHCLFVIK